MAKNNTDAVSTGNEKSLGVNSEILIGLLLFGLFFGAGNIIFPVKMGQDAAKNFIASSFGFIITAAGIPILGVISFALSKKNKLTEYAGVAGPFFKMFFPLALYLTIGPFFAIPRTATVAFEVGISPFVGDNSRLPLFIYSLIFFVLVWIFSSKPNNIMNIVGKVLTPLFLILISVLLIAVFINPAYPFDLNAPKEVYLKKPIFQGILDGYNTMDGLASLAFAIVIIESVKQMNVKSHKLIAKETAKSGMVTIFLLAVIYAALVYLGACTGKLATPEDNGGLMLSYVSHHYFGSTGQILLASIIGVACLKTAIGLVVAIGTAFASIFEKTEYKLWKNIFILVSFVIANFGLNTIISWSIPVLVFLYPLAITLMILWILYSVLNFNQKTFKLTILLTSIPAFFDFIKTLPLSENADAFKTSADSFAKICFPMYDLGLGWMIPAILGIIIGIFVFGKEKNLA